MNHQVLDEDHQERQQFGFRATVALNNMACTLLERSRTRQGFCTYRDAISTLKLTIKQQREEGSDNDSRQQILSMLKQANRRVSQSNTEQQLSNSMCSSTSYTPTKLCSIEEFSSSKQSSMEIPIASRPHSLIRIDSNDFDEMDASGDPGFLASIVLFNFGVAYQCRATMEESSGDKLRESGIKLLDCSRNSLIAQLENEEEFQDPFTTHKLISICIVVVEAQVKALQACNRWDEAQSALGEYQCLEQAARSIMEDQFAHYYFGSSQGALIAARAA